MNDLAAPPQDEQAGDSSNYPRFGSAARMHIPSWLEKGGAWGFRFVGLTAALGLILYVLFHIRVAVLPIPIAILVTTLVAPVAGVLRKARLPAALASALSLLLLLGVLGGLGALIAIAVSGEFGQLGESIERGYRQLVEQAARLVGVGTADVKGWVDSHLSNLQSFNGLAATAATQIRGLLEGLTVITLALVFTFLFTWDGKRQFGKVVELLPQRRREGAEELGRRIWDSVGRYMRGMFIIATADALLLGIGYWAIGMTLVLPLMLLMFLAAFVPFIGPLIAATVAALVGMAEGDLTLAAFAVGVAFIVQQIEGNLLHPLVMGRAMQLHPSVILFAITAGGVLGGVVGIFLAIPVATTVSTTFEFFRESRGETEAKHLA